MLHEIGLITAATVFFLIRLRRRRYFRSVGTQTELRRVEAATQTDTEDGMDIETDSDDDTSAYWFFENLNIRLTDFENVADPSV